MHRDPFFGWEKDWMMAKSRWADEGEAHIGTNGEPSYGKVKEMPFVWDQSFDWFNAGLYFFINCPS